ncbi:PREDICTED: hemogen isoform X1 [Lepidothrix coronata]|uniref:Hemogen isoform X1 n=1 Tax=Lepidothrix coronata TaxID=321398 RepID=A0A6J0HDX0_9PASS|nr:PREDICTED: hemogen isoform X1 [Lepidothrix coronata]
MESLSKDHPSPDSSLPRSAARKEYAVPDVIITHRLRDRELLRKRKAEALEKDSTQWVLRVHKNQQQKRGRGAKRGRGRQPEVKATLDPEPTTDPQPELHEEAEPVHSEPALPEPVHSEPALPEPVHSEPALPEPVYQEQLPMLTVHNPVSGMQPVAVEGEPAARSLDPAGEEEVVKPTEAEILEDFNTPLENDHQDNEFNTHVLY